MKKSFYPPLFVLSICFFCVAFSPANGQSGEWRVWVKTSPCSGRFDWITVAKDNPSGGLNAYYLANTVFPSAACTAQGCTFNVATALAASLRQSNQFSNYCCRDYSVWQNTQTRQMSVVLGKQATAGLGWILVRGNLCCEEAESLSGIPGACSGGANQQAVQNTQCYPGSYAAWNAQADRVECYCNPGLVWNSTRTACIQAPVTQVNCWPGSYAALNPQTNKTECYCNPGLVWNDTKTACIQPATKQINCWPGSYAAINPQTSQTECYCNPGLVWNATKTACVQPVATQVNCWPGSYAAVNPQTNQTECFCNPGLVWNSTKTACVQPATAHVACWPGSYAAVNSQTNKTECFCNPGLVWNSTNTACVTPGNNVDAVGAGTWTLVSVTANPVSRPDWKYNAQSGTAHLDVYNGDQADFQWTQPPQQFGSGGFTVTVSVQGKPAPKSRIAALIGVSGRGLETDAPSDQRSAYATPPEGPASASRSVTFKPSKSSSEIEVMIGMMWGGLEISYKYKKAQ